MVAELLSALGGLLVGTLFGAKLKEYTLVEAKKLELLAEKELKNFKAQVTAEVHKIEDKL